MARRTSGGEGRRSIGLVVAEELARGETASAPVDILVAEAGRSGVGKGE